MYALFIAQGSKFKQQQFELVYNLDIFNLMAHILDVTDVATNGTNTLINYALK